jgi:hypothetical protein
VSAAAADARRKVAARHDWDLLVAQIADAFQTRLDARANDVRGAAAAAPTLDHRRDAHAE